MALNTALFQDGALVHVPKGEVIQEPIHLLYLSTGVEEAMAIHPRTLILADGNSQVSVLESYVGLQEGVYFTNSVTEIVSAFC